MKKKITILSLIPILFTLVSCNKEAKMSLVYGSIAEAGIQIINYSDLALKVKNEENFVLSTTPDSNCSCWNTFKIILGDYSEEKNFSVYTISHKELLKAEDSDKPTYGINHMSDRPTFVLFNDGKIFDQRVYDSKDSIFKQETSFITYFEGKVNLPRVYYINKEYMDNLFTKDIKFSIYFARSNCEDCGYINKTSLKSYLKNHLEYDKFYILDCEKIGIREYDENNQLTPASQEKWNDFKDEYGLSNAVNTVFGYNTGYVPSFITYQGGEEVKASSIITMTVTFNDTIEKDGDNYIVSDSYYTTERVQKLEYLKDKEGSVLKGLKISKDDVDAYEKYNYYAWQHEKAAKYHDGFLTSYLDYINTLY